ncbi:hypothetical protein BZA77DRAFT_164226 [Pyronema omphalodes]|nr:hypothetical protein BZA77DRAFT_164226 [Pyronema omphalodes]
MLVRGVAASLLQQFLWVGGWVVGRVLRCNRSKKKKVVPCIYRCIAVAKPDYDEFRVRNKYPCQVHGVGRQLNQAMNNGDGLRVEVGIGSSTGEESGVCLIGFQT